MNLLNFYHYIELLFFEKNDFTFSIYRHIIDVRATTFTIFSEELKLFFFFLTSKPNAGT
jgi:hypothetical protein